MPIPFLSLRRDAQNPRRGRIAERTLNLGGEAEIRRYAYDSAGRLARVADGSGGLLESYQYDHEGRRLADINPQRFRGERRYSYAAGNRLSQAGRVQYGHDKAGFRNLKIEATSSGQRETHYHYEPSGLLLRVDLPDGRCIDYAYDAKGQRTEKRINGRVVEAYRWLDPLRLSEFHDGQRWWRLAYDSERPGHGSRTPVGVTNSDDSYFLLCDQVGTPVALATHDGHVVQTMQYDSFGNLLQVRGDAVRLPIGFAGGLFDGDTGLTRFVWRDYDADTGRFTALDPMGAKGGDTDWYGYCVDDPVNRVDTWGLEDEDAVQVCKRPVQIDNEYLADSVDHYFIKTPRTESGMGIPGQAAEQGDSVGDLLSPTQWTDHTGQSQSAKAQCWTVPNVDPQCVDKLAKPGNDTGRWLPGFNDCRTNVTEVLKFCRTDVK